MIRSSAVVSMGLGLALFTVACGGTEAPARTAGSAEAAGAESSVPLTGNVIEVKMASIGGEVFKPADITVQRGDVVRFVLESGVHNASFPADRNPAGVTLPEPTPYLQVPGQSHDVVVDLPAGLYHFQCDPHVPLGMVGTMTVQD